MPQAIQPTPSRSYGSNPTSPHVLDSAGSCRSFAVTTNRSLLHFNHSRAQVLGQTTDTVFDRVKKANHPRGWDAKPRDLNRDGICSRVSLAATQSMISPVRLSLPFPRCLPLNSSLNRMEVPHDFRDTYSTFGPDCL